jgi:hypothetical protein
MVTIRRSLLSQSTQPKSSESLEVQADLNMEISKKKPVKSVAKKIGKLLEMLHEFCETASTLMSDIQCTTLKS